MTLILVKAYVLSKTDHSNLPYRAIHQSIVVKSKYSQVKVKILPCCRYVIPMSQDTSARLLHTLLLFFEGHATMGIGKESKSGNTMWQWSVLSVVHRRSQGRGIQAKGIQRVKFQKFECCIEMMFPILRLLMHVRWIYLFLWTWFLKTLVLTYSNAGNSHIL